MLQKLNDIRENKLKNNDSGFTIIEVMIVLAIAALILVVVFLAVPALQRSSRNTKRNQVAANLLAEVNSYKGNNGGKLPSTCSDSGDSLGTNCDFLESFKADFYGSSDSTVSVTDLSPNAPGGSMFNGADAASTDKLQIVLGTECATVPYQDGTIQVAQEANSTKQITAIYTIEASSGSGPTYSPQCKEG